MNSKMMRWGVGMVVLGFVLIQGVRFIIPAFELENPAVKYTVEWDSPETQQLWTQACADCHSNETTYPWYAYIAPVGWLVARDVHNGRAELNISEDRSVELEEMIEVIEEGEMPLPIYTIMHPEAKLSESQRDALIAGLEATFSNSSTHERDNDDDE